MIRSRTLLLAAALTITTCSVAWAQTQPKDPFDKGNCPRGPKSQQDIDACSRMIKENQRDPDLYLNRSNGWVVIGNRDKQNEDIEKAVELSPGYWRVWAARGLFRLNKGEHDKALSDFNRAIELDPKRASAYNGWAMSWMAKGYYDRAIADYNRAIDLDPNVAVPYYNGSVLT